MELMVWNVVLSFVSALILLWIKSATDELRRVQILLNRTREEIAKEYVTKMDVHADINRVLVRLEQLEAKLDRLIMEKHHAPSK